MLKAAKITTTTCRDYYPFGMEMPGRSYEAGDYRFGFNGMEIESDASNGDNIYTSLYRFYDCRLARWYSIDPMVAALAGESPYSGIGNSPLSLTDPLGNFADKWEINTDNGTVTRVDGTGGANTQHIIETGSKGGASYEVAGSSFNVANQQTTDNPYYSVSLSGDQYIAQIQDVELGIPSVNLTKPNTSVLGGNNPTISNTQNSSPASTDPEPMFNIELSTEAGFKMGVKGKIFGYGTQAELGVSRTITQVNASDLGINTGLTPGGLELAAGLGIGPFSLSGTQGLRPINANSSSGSANLLVLEGTLTPRSSQCKLTLVDLELMFLIGARLKVTMSPSLFYGPSVAPPPDRFTPSSTTPIDQTYVPQPVIPAPPTGF